LLCAFEQHSEMSVCDNRYIGSQIARGRGLELQACRDRRPGTSIVYRLPKEQGHLKHAALTGYVSRFRTICIVSKFIMPTTVGVGITNGSY
jgi:hypothetical protein